MSLSCIVTVVCQGAPGVSVVSWLPAFMLPVLIDRYLYCYNKQAYGIDRRQISGNIKTVLVCATALLQPALATLKQ